MRIVVDIGHPAHVHLFKNFVWEMEKRGHEILITASKKEVSLRLLDAYGFDYIHLGSYGFSIVRKIANIPVMDLRMYRAIKDFKPDIFVGLGSVRGAHVSKLMGRPSITFNDTESGTHQTKILYAPFTDAILTPSCFKEDLGKKQIRYNGYHELAYLHPNYFKPNPAILDELGLSRDDTFIILRFVAWRSPHEVGQHGIKNKTELVQELEKYGRVFITSEGELDKNLEKYKIKVSPEKLHDLLFYASLCISEGSTTAVESALLGVPTVHFERLRLDGKVCGITPFIGVLDELQNEYSLLYSYYNEKELLVKVEEIITNIDTIKKKWKEKREKLLKDKTDVTAFMVWFIENYPESFREMKENPEIQHRFRSTSKEGI